MQNQTHLSFLSSAMCEVFQHHSPHQMFWGHVEHPKNSDNDTRANTSITKSCLPFVSSHLISGSSAWISLIHQISYSLEQQGSLHLAEVLSITPVHYPYIIFLYSNLIPQHPVPLASVWSNRPRQPPQHPRAKRPRPPFLTTSCNPLWIYEIPLHERSQNTY